VHLCRGFLLYHSLVQETAGRGFSRKSGVIASAVATVRQLPDRRDLLLL
jgi:hypothetical protein